MKTWTKMRVLVTGGAGFIGSALVWELNNRGCENIVIADFLGRTEKWRNLRTLRFADYVEADELLPRLRSGALGQFDLVLHMGACSSTTETDLAYLIRNNYEYTKTLAEWALASGSRFVYASSAATYGDGRAGWSDREEQLTRFQPLNPYGYSKHLFDLYAWRKGWLKQIIGLKYFNVFGPNEEHKGEMRSMVSKGYAQIVATGKLRLFRSYHPAYRDGEQKRDFLYVKDAVAMTLHLAAHPDAHGLYNIGSGQAHTWLELANALFAAMNRPPQIEFVDMPETIRAQYQYCTQADISKLRDTGYARPVTPLAEAVADYVTNYLTKGATLSSIASEPAS
ncbi:MAG: ADP-glyceromanno-heptose 6-epimerase [Verrucomicrobiae bacterium]|nr:ADP-glyceromanno-heptose 6-epimerase [Verrucomicrobiae bacterium]